MPGLGVVQGAPTMDSREALSSSAQRCNTPGAAPSLWDRALLALGSVGRVEQGLLPGTTRPPPPASKIASAYITVFTNSSTKGRSTDPHHQGSGDSLDFCSNLSLSSALSDRCWGRILRAISYQSCRARESSRRSRKLALISR